MSIEPAKNKILIVDDNPETIKILGEALKQSYDVVIATNGEKALAMVEEAPPDLILLDIEMPKMDGYEVCRRIKSNGHTHHIPIIFISAVEDETKGFDLGAVDYIVKPFNMAAVNARVLTHLNLKRKSELLEELASIDGLTNLPNLRRFEETINAEWSRARRTKLPLSLGFVEIDFFKEYEMHGKYAAGDECLKMISIMFRSFVKRRSDFLARYDTEKMAILFPDTKLEAAVKIAEQIRRGIENLNIPHPESKISKTVTLSIGISSTIPSDKLTVSDLIKAANSSLSEAKEQGRNRAHSISI